MLSFIQWVREVPMIGIPTAEKEVLDEIALDPDFPQTVRFHVILDYLTGKKYGKRKIGLVQNNYNEYIKYISRAADPDK
ncbi:MAG: hypothetical protein IJ060_02550 [Oscillospiraceae bacterium]|nr:hypothetical protein [Oscillospiraceae bacterium]